MAVIKLGCSKSSSNTLTYCEKKAQVKDSLNCSVSFADLQFKSTRKIWGKDSGVQAHTIIQSFKPQEIDAVIANEIGMKLAVEIAKNHEVAVFTHSDKDHIHNHIVINSVNFETGKKYQSNPKHLHKIRTISDELCKEYGLSIINDHESKIRYTLAEKSILEKGKSSWKDEIRSAIDSLKYKLNNYDDFKNSLKEKYDIDVNDKGKYITFKHPDNNKVVRGKTLGFDYEEEVIKDVLSRQITERINSNRKITSNERREQDSIRKQPAQRSISSIQRTVRGIDEKVRSLTGDGRREQKERQRREQENIKRIEQERSRFEKLQRDFKSEYRELDFEHDR